MLEERAQLGQERGADGAVDDAVVAREGQGEPLPDGDRAVADDGRSRTCPTARIAPSGGLMTAANWSIPNIPRFEIEKVPCVISSG